jgi:hypothetical protein
MRGERAQCVAADGDGIITTNLSTPRDPIQKDVFIIFDYSPALALRFFDKHAA